jgi:carbamoyl-phosphate synthase large subunit
MEIVHDGAQLDRYLARLTLDLGRPSELAVSKKRPLLIDRYLTNATEVDVDCLADGKDTFIAGVMEHIEEAGIHSGDSACALPPHSLDDKTIAELERQTRALALALNVGGLMNVQYAIKDGEIYVLEVNPRASRTVPFVAKVIGLPVAKIAARVMAGEPLAAFKLQPPRLDHIGVKEAVFPFARFPGVDTVLGPEMKSTGEVIGLDRTFETAFAKSQIGGGSRLPRGGTVFVSVRDEDKPRILEAMRLLAGLGFKVIATGGTQRFLMEQGGAGREDQQGAGRAPAYRRRHQEWRRPARFQHHGGGEGARGLPLPAARSPLA